MGLVKHFICRYELKAIRNNKFIIWAYNLINYRKLSYLKPIFKDVGLNRNHLLVLQYDNLKHLSPASFIQKEIDPSHNYLLKHQTYLSLSTEYQNEVKNWTKNGYIHLKNFFDSDDIDQMAQINDSLWQTSKGKWRFGDRRVLSAFENKETWHFFHQKKLRSIINMLLNQEAVLLNNINFLRGDEQPIHSDSFYMSTHPVGELVGIWVALEDIDKDAGPLCYIPNSHLLPYITNQEINNLGNFWRTGIDGDQSYILKVKEIISKHNLSPKSHLPKKGDLFLWHANLLHGGSKIYDPTKTRKSMVGHFVGKNAICYHENSQRPALRHNIPSFGDS